MITIERDQPHCTVIVTVDASPEVLADMKPHARDGLTLFAQMAGFVSGVLHQSQDGRRLVQYLQWESQAHHEACMNDSRWEASASAQRFMGHIASGEATIHVGVYEIVETSSFGGQI